MKVLLFGILAGLAGSACVASGASAQASSPASAFTVLFVHGFDSDSLTWQRFRLLAEADPRLRFATTDALTWSSRSGCTGRSSSMTAGVTDLMLAIKRALVSPASKGSLAIVAHSAGGLLTWMAMSRLSQEDTASFRRVKLVYTLSTPLGGATSGWLLGRLCPNTLLNELGPNSEFTVEARRAAIDVLQRAREAKTGLHVIAACETVKTSIVVQNRFIVAPGECALPTSTSEVQHSRFAADHSAMIRPESYHAPSYETLIQALSSLYSLPSCNRVGHVTGDTSHDVSAGLEVFGANHLLGAHDRQRFGAGLRLLVALDPITTDSVQSPYETSPTADCPRVGVRVRESRGRAAFVWFIEGEMIANREKLEGTSLATQALIGVETRRASGLAYLYLTELALQARETGDTWAWGARASRRLDLWALRMRLGADFLWARSHGRSTGSVPRFGLTLQAALRTSGMGGL